jgi:hypothetical protein
MGLSLLWIPLHVLFLADWVPAEIKAWEEMSRYQVVRKEQVHRSPRKALSRIFKDPFFRTAIGFQVLYRIRVRDAKGQTRTGWMGIGSYWWPSASRFEVHWDDQEARTPEPGPAAPPSDSPLWDRELDP